MQFALLGDHPDGLDLARALVETGRHTVSYYCGPATGVEFLSRWDVAPQREGDMEAVLADPTVAAVIVAGRLSTRSAQLRRALQSERHVLCVHPADVSPDAAYEAAMIQGDTRQVLLPILPEALHPAFRRLADLLTPAKRVRLIEMERWYTDDVAEESDNEDIKTSLSGWDVLRLVGGDIGEVTALSPGETMTPNQPVVVCGQFTRGGLFQASYLPQQSAMRWRITAITETSHIELLFHAGWPGPATLSWIDDLGQPQRETWESWNPWPAVVEAFEAALPGGSEPSPKALPGRLPDKSEHIQTARDGVRHRVQTTSPEPGVAFPTWHDETRALELDDAARRSVAKRRTSVLDFQEVTEEATFKGTMTLVGCSIVWISLMLLILSTWLPWLAWIIVPVFVLFLIVQIVLRWVVRPSQESSMESPADAD